MRDEQERMTLWMDKGRHWQGLLALMARTRRTMTEEVLHAIERHLDAPPEVIAPPLDAATVKPSAKPKRGRPRKDGEQ